MPCTEQCTLQPQSMDCWTFQEVEEVTKPKKVKKNQKFVELSESEEKEIIKEKKYIGGQARVNFGLCLHRFTQVCSV